MRIGNSEERTGRTDNARLIVAISLMVILIGSVNSMSIPYARAQESTPASTSYNFTNSESSGSSSSPSNDNSTSSNSEVASNDTSSQNDAQTNEEVIDSQNQTSDVPDPQPDNATDVSGSVSAEIESLQTATGPITRSFSYPVLQFEGETVSEIRQSITWGVDGSVAVADNRGYEYTLIPSVDGKDHDFKLLYDENRIVQQISIGGGTEYLIIWNEASRDGGPEKHYKFSIVGAAMEPVKIRFNVVSGMSAVADNARFMLLDRAVTDALLSSAEQSDSGDFTSGDGDSSFGPGSSGNSSHVDRAVDLVRFASSGGSLGLDWSDATDAGYEVNFLPATSSIEIVVEKAGPFDIDPVTVATTTATLSPGSGSYYEGERRVIKVTGRLFAFFYNGSDILYSVSEDDGSTWGSTQSAGTGTLGQEGYRWTLTTVNYNGEVRVILFYWTPSGTSQTGFYARYAAVTDTEVNWQHGAQLLFSVDNYSGCNGTCAAVTADTSATGDIYAAFRYLKSGSFTYQYKIMKSTDGGASWSTSLAETSSANSYRVEPAITDLAGGKMLFVYATYHGSAFYYRIFDGSTWGSILNTGSGTVQANTIKQISIDSDSTNTPYLAYVSGGNTGSLKLVKWTNQGTSPAVETADSTLSHSLPSITITADDAIRVYSLSNSKVYETVKSEGAWQTPGNPFGTSFSSPEQLTAAISYPGALWIEGSNIRFDSVPDEVLANQHALIIEELDQIGLTLNQTTITPALVDDINATLSSLEDVAIELQNLGFDGYISTERANGQVVGIIKFNNSAGATLIETEIPDGTLGVFMTMALIRGFSEQGFPFNSTEVAALLNASSIFVDLYTNLEDDDLPFQIVAASVASFYPSTGNTVHVDIAVPFHVTESCFSRSFPATVASLFNFGLNIGDLALTIVQALDEIVAVIMDYSYQRADIPGIKFNDVNGNGTRDNPTGEPGLGNFTFSIHTIHGSPNDPCEWPLNTGPVLAVSNSTGHFMFDNVRIPIFVDEIVVVEEEKAGWQVTSPSSGLLEIIFTPANATFSLSQPPVFESAQIEFGNRQVRNSLVFDGASSSLMRVLNHSDYQNLSAMSISLWIKQFSDDTAGNYAAKGDSWSIVQTSTRKIAINYFSTNSDNTPDNAIVPDTWHHVVVTINPTAPDGNWRKIYVDGVRVDVLTSGGSIDPIRNNGDLEFGGGSHVKLWDLRFYDVEVSSTDVTNLYQGQNVVGGLVSHWSLSEGSGTSISDSVGGHTGTLIGSVSWDSDKPS